MVRALKNYVWVSGASAAISHGRIKRSRRAVFFFLSNAAARPRRHKIMQYSSSGTTAAVLQALAFVPVTVRVCGWCTAAGGDQTTTTLSRPSQQSNTRCRTSHQEYDGYNRRKKRSSPHISLERLCSPFSTCDAPGTSIQPHPEQQSCIILPVERLCSPVSTCDAAGILGQSHPEGGA